MKLLIIPVTILSLGGLGLVGAGSKILLDRGDQAPDSAVGIVVLGLIAIAVGCGVAYNSKN